MGIGRIFFSLWLALPAALVASWVQVQVPTVSTPYLRVSTSSCCQHQRHNNYKRPWPRRSSMLLNMLANNQPACTRKELPSPGNCNSNNNTATAALLQAVTSDDDDDDDLPNTNSRTNQELRSLLQTYNLDQRLLSIHSNELPVVAEVFLKGASHLCEIMALRPTKDPTVQVKIISSTPEHDNSDSSTKQDVVTVAVDIGQITTIWDRNKDDSDDSCWWEQVPDQLNRLPVGSTEAAMDGLYKSHVGRASSNGNKSKKTLSKKQITKLTTTISNEIERQHAEHVLRQVIKAGTGYSRLVDSAVAATYLHNDDKGIMATSNPKTKGSQQTDGTTTTAQQAVAAHILAQDSATGGRFKRMPCTFVDRTMTSDDSEVESFSVINGGWLVVDQSVRAGAEARKFATRVEQSSKQRIIIDDDDDDGKQQQQQQQTTAGWTVSDERIAQRLECLAMGEVLSSQGSEDKSSSKALEQQSLELDVREALKALGTPTTPEGARDVLVTMGRWSKGQTPGAAQPWSPKIIEAARWYVDYCKSVKSSKERALQEGRSDLTNIPFVCVDAKRTSFRDDAIGVRPRSMTGRKVSEESKWEILISIVDVSDIYVDATVGDEEPLRYFKALRDAAACRGVSRYDLPLGPLHLLPPVALKGLSLETVNPGEVSKGFNRCVTVWVYIDEKTGNLMDAGVERSVISQPVAFSYGSATALLDDKIGTNGDKQLGKARQLLAVVERNLNAWSEHRRQHSSAAQKREDRLTLKEFVANQQVHSNQRDDGQDGFRRTSGHKLVDTSLDIYSYVLAGSMRRAKAFVPQQAGSEQGRGGRVATAPLRRYVDGMAQRQVLSVLCDYGGPTMTKAECIRVSQEATDAYNSISNIRSLKRGKRGLISAGFLGQKGAVRKLEFYLAGDKDKIIPAVGTGRGNDVVVKGVGALAKLKGLKQPLKAGKEVLVRVLKIDAESGNLSVSLAKEEH